MPITKLNVKIRGYYAEDFSTLTALEKANSGSETSFANSVKMANDRKNSRLLHVASVGKTPVGYCFFARLKDHILIHRMLVASHLRRQGIGTEFFRGIFANLNAPDLNQIRVWVHEDSLGEQLFYRRLKFIADPYTERNPLLPEHFEMTYFFDYLDINEFSQ